MLEGQCDVWSGTISAAVYIALVGGKAVSVELNSNQDPHLIALSRVVAAFRQFHELAEQKGVAMRWLACLGCARERVSLVELSIRSST